MGNTRLLLILSLCALLQACGGLKLIDVSKSSAALQLTTAQQETVHPKLKLIRDIVEDYDFEKSQRHLRLINALSWRI